VLAAAALVLAACRGNEGDDVASTGEPYSDETTAVDAAGAEAAGAQPAPAAWLEELQRGAPEDVARLLLQWDTAGLRFEGRYADALAELYCYQPEQQCRSDEPAWDFRGARQRPVRDHVR
jgi:hypothetical protein